MIQQPANLAVANLSLKLEERLTLTGAGMRYRLLQRDSRDTRGSCNGGCVPHDSRPYGPSGQAVNETVPFRCGIALPGQCLDLGVCAAETVGEFVGERLDKAQA